MDVSVYIRLIHSIAPEALTQEEAEELLSNPDKKAVAERIIEIIRQFDLKQQFFITAEDIIAVCIHETSNHSLGNNCIFQIEHDLHCCHFRTLWYRFDG
jgi:BioD-like phosphotransacetylase family protein